MQSITNACVSMNTGQARQPKTESMFTMNLHNHKPPTAAAPHGLGCGVACVQVQGCTLLRLYAFTNAGFGRCLKADKLELSQSVMHKNKA